MTADKKPYLIWLPVALVTALLSLSIFYTYYNQQVIHENHVIETEAEQIRSNVSEILWGTIQGIDLGLRGYGLIREERFIDPMVMAIEQKDTLFADIEAALLNQEFDMEVYYQFRDSMEAYIAYVEQMKMELERGNDSIFIAMLHPDIGYNLWLEYEQFSQKIDDFENQVKAEADERYQSASTNLYLAQIGLLLVLFPTMMLYVYYFRKSLRVSAQLIETRDARAELIRKQNQELENQVSERTKALRMQMSIIESQHEELMAVNQAKDKIFSVLSHDLRGPLNNLQSAIIGFHNKIFTPEEADMLLQKLETNFEQTNELLNNLLVWSKSQMKGISLEKDDFDLTESLTDLTEVFRETSNAKNITITNDSDEHLQVKAGREMIEMVIRNLLNNAIKFTPEGGVINIHAESKDDAAVVEISDSGVGMNDETVDTILKEGYVASTPGTNKEKGTGMGLMLVKEFIKLHHGTFEIISKQSSGTTIRFSIPKN
ncbi:ATP-binding protein [uncultured Imperialibacter sp.]|uniref:sensor histidine kinase n=1 Tax=uncultured Imperialibacter sp. TaxID=1672639 RepID=UPI0030DC76AE|tara:strand:- start:34210 stop:35673 length:1464 start_codon:yes stop_codon:yes gene_type:complete